MSKLEPLATWRRSQYLRATDEELTARLHYALALRIAGIALTPRLNTYGVANTLDVIIACERHLKARNALK